MGHLIHDRLLGVASGILDMVDLYAATHVVANESIPADQKFAVIDHEISLRAYGDRPATALRLARSLVELAAEPTVRAWGTMASEVGA